MDYEAQLQTRIDELSQEMFAVNYDDIIWPGHKQSVLDKLKEELQASDDPLLRLAASLGL
jgi:hypothetical protein